MSDDPVNDALNAQMQIAQMRAWAGATDNPDNAARAIQLSNATGVDPNLVHDTLPDFEQGYKEHVSRQIVGDDPIITNYVNSHPLAASVANDDYATLGGISHTMSTAGWLWQTAKNSAAALVTPPTAFQQGFGEAPLGTMLFKPEEFAAHPVLGSVAAAAATVPEAAVRTLGGVTNYALTSAFGQEKAERIGQILMDPGLQMTIEGIGPAGAGVAALETVIGRALTSKAGTYLSRGRVPPRGIDPNVDGLAAQLNQQSLDAINSVADNAQLSTLRERSPEMFQQFQAPIMSGASLGIDGQKVLDLYGDRLPTPDDGLFGWVPNIAEQLEVARDTGADIKIPINDWTTKVDPAIRSQLLDDTRAIPQGLTTNESKLFLSRPEIPAVDDLTALDRQATATEPLFSLGDRKLTIQRLEGEPVEGGQFGEAQGFHDFDLVNEKGESVGTVNLSEADAGKTLNVEMVNGLGEYYNPNRFGPALIRDVAKQIADEFPNAKYLTGHRVSGAREAAGTAGEPSALPKIDLGRLRRREPLASRQDYNDLYSVFGGAWQRVHPDVEAQIIPGDMWLRHENEIAQGLAEEAIRIAPQMDVKTVGGINVKGEPVRGVYLPGDKPLTLVSLAFPGHVSTLRHEVIHDFRKRGFFLPEEWTALEDAAQKENWIDHHQINERYNDLHEEGKIEEAIADTYPEWKEQYGARKTQPGFEPTLVDKAFEKLDQLIEAIKNQFRKITGRPLTAEDVFKRIDSGEVGRRKPIGKRTERIMASRPPIENAPGSPFENARDVGMAIKEHQEYMKLIAERQAADIEASTQRIERIQRQRQTKEWKAAGEAIRGDVVEDLNRRPVIAADKFFASGELRGRQIKGWRKLSADALTPEQIASLPPKFVVKTGGVIPDAIAPMFGFASGDQMVAGLAKFHEAREESGLPRDAFMRQLIAEEINRRVERQHGFLEKNIAEETADQVESENNLDLLHIETHLLAKMAGKKGSNLTRDQLMPQLKAKFDQLPMELIESKGYEFNAGKAGRAVEEALRKQNPAEAFRQRQVQYYNMIYAKFAKDIESEAKKFAKIAGRFANPFDPKKTSIDPTYSLFIRNVLAKVGLPNGMSPSWMAKAIGETSAKSLEGFVVEVNAEYSLSGVNLPVADILLDPTFNKPFAKLTAPEFRAVRDSVVGMNKFAREIHKVNIAGEKFDRANLITDLRQKLETKFPVLNLATTKKPSMAKLFLAASTNLETLFARFDGRDPKGLWTKTFTYPAAEAANNADVIGKETARKLKTAGNIDNPTKKMVSPLIDPKTKLPLGDFDRSHLATIISNMGNEYNWRVFTKGWEADPDVLRGWVEANTTAADFDRAQAIGNIFNDLKSQSDMVYQRMYDIAPENIEIKPFTIHGKTYDGWYHPIIRDPIRSKKSILAKADPSEGPRGSYWPSTSNSYAKRRTGAIDVISLDQSAWVAEMNKIIHDIAFREFVHNTAKLTRDNTFRDGVLTRYGSQYVEEIDKWLERIAGITSTNDMATARAIQYSKKLRSNVVSTYVAFNPTTIEKHGITAGIFSAREVGIAKFAKTFAEVSANLFYHAVTDLFGKSPYLGDSLWKFAIGRSEELQRRDRNFQETIGGQVDLHLGKLPLRQRVMELGAKGVAFSDMLSAVPTWLAKYREVMADIGDIGQATREADRAVRRAHGSTSISNLPSIASGESLLAPWMTSLYGFFGTNAQRLMEVAHDLNDIYKMGKEGELKAASKTLSSTVASIFTYAIWPGIVEELVTSQFYDDKSKGGLLGHLGWATFKAVGASIIGIRELTHAFETNNDPGVGLISSVGVDVMHLVRDAKKGRITDRQNVGRVIEHALTVLGDFKGISPKHVGTVIHYGIDVLNNVQRPHGIGDIYRGVTTGHQEVRKVK